MCTPCGYSARGTAATLIICNTVVGNASLEEDEEAWVWGSRGLGGFPFDQCSVRVSIGKLERKPLLTSAACIDAKHNFRSEDARESQTYCTEFERVAAHANGLVTQTPD